jgi:hypothetical protein
MEENNIISVLTPETIYRYIPDRCKCMSECLDCHDQSRDCRGPEHGQNAS